MNTNGSLLRKVSFRKGYKLILSMKVSRRFAFNLSILSLVSIKLQGVAKCRRVSQNFGSATLCDERKHLCPNILRLIAIRVEKTHTISF